MPLKILTAAAGATIILVILLALDIFNLKTGTGNLDLPPETLPVQVAAVFASVPEGLGPATTTAATVVPAPASPTATTVPTATRKPTATAIAVSSPTVMAGSLNGVPIQRIVVMPEPVKNNIRLIFARGQALGRNARAFSKVGDSTMAYPPFLAAFDQSYRLGSYSYLQRAIDRFAGSFGRESAAVRKSMHTWSQFDPAWVNSDACQSHEGPLACELRLNNPSIAIIRLGANDVSAPELFNEQLRRIVKECLDYGVIPVLGTKPDRLEGPANTLNGIVGRIASDYSIPLWDYDLIAGTVPGKGLLSDKVHFRDGGSHDYTSPRAFSGGDSLEDLTGLMMLDAMTRELMVPTAR